MTGPHRAAAIFIQYIVLYDKLTRTENPRVSVEPSSSIHQYSGEVASLHSPAWKTRGFT